MEPQNQTENQQPTGMNGAEMPPNQAPSMPPSGPAPKRSKKRLITILVVLVVLLLGAGAYALFMNSDSDDEPVSTAQTENNTSTEPENTEEEPAGCDEGMTEFAGDNIGLHFCYPVSWGNASLKDGPEKTADHLVAGDGRQIEFSGNPDVVAGLRSTDWKHNDMGHDGIGQSGYVTFAQAKQAKEYIKANQVYVDTDSQFSYVYACFEICSGTPFVELQYTIKFDNPKFESITFYQRGPEFGDEYKNKEHGYFDPDLIGAADVTSILPKTDSRFVVLEQVAGTVRN